MGRKKQKQAAGGGGEDDRSQQGESSQQQQQRGPQQQQERGGQQQQQRDPQQQQQRGPQQQQERGQQQQQRGPQWQQERGGQQQQQRGPQWQQERGGQQQQQRDPQQQQQRGPQQQQERGQQQQQRGPQWQQERGGHQQQQRGPQWQQERGGQQQQQRDPQQQQQRGPQQQQERGGQQQRDDHQQRGPWQQQQRGPQQQQQWGHQQQQQRGPQQQQQQRHGQQQQQTGPQYQQERGGQQQRDDHQQRGPWQQQQRGPQQQQQQRDDQQQRGPWQQQQRGPQQQQQRGPQQQQQHRGPQQQQKQWGPQVQQEGPPPLMQHGIPPQMQQWGPPQMQPGSPPQMQEGVPSQMKLMQALVEGIVPVTSPPPSSTATSPTPSQESSSSGVVPKAAAGDGGKRGPKQKQEKPSGAKPPSDKKEAKQPQKPSDEELALAIPPRKKSDKKPGRLIQLETNHFLLNVSQRLKVVFQYDVTMDPDRPKKMLPTVMEAFRKKHFPKRFPAYDGMKNLFAASLLPLPANNELTDTITVRLPDEEKDKDYKVTVKYNGKEIDMSPLQEYFRASPGQTHRLPPQDVLLVIDIVLRSAPALTFISVGRSYFSPPQGQIIRLGDGMEMYNGFYQSAIVGWKPFLNVDVAHKAFPLRLDGINLLMDLLRCSENDLQRPLRPFDIDVVHRFLSTLKVQYLIPSQPGSRRVMRVNGVDQPAEKAVFNHNNEQMTVKDYFNKIKGYRLRYPHLPCLWVGNRNRPDKILLPIELCTVLEGQAVNRKMTPDQTSAMIKYAATNTEIRKNKIMTAVNNANYNQNPVVREFDISVSAKMEQIKGRVLVPPMIGYANKTEKPFKGVWRSQRFYQNSELKSWTILNLDYRTREPALKEFAAMMQMEGQKLGMNIAPPAPFLTGLDNRNPLNSIVNHMKNLKYQLVVVVLPDNVPNVYSYVKQVAELQVGLLTQCVRSKNVFRPKNMTVMNILLKVNSKLNGINHILAQRPACLSRPCMIMGADVTHPSPDAQETPSVAAVTASHDPTAFMYNICWRLQPPREEIIVDLENIVCEQLKYFYEKNRQRKPEHIIFFRDGVSEGFFKFVMNREVQAIRKACTRLNPEYKPAITFLVVQKRHHTRLFPVNPRDSEDRNFNVPAGTCVDEWITHPTATDFYLVSHASIQGVAKPTKYRVLWDDKDMTENELEELSYHLCHMFSRCTRSVSYPAPTYYAHLAAARAKVYIETRRVNINQLQREQEQTQIKELIIKGQPMFFV